MLRLLTESRSNEISLVNFILILTRILIALPLIIYYRPISRGEAERLSKRAREKNSDTYLEYVNVKTHKLLNARWSSSRKTKLSQPF